MSVTMYAVLGFSMMLILTVVLVSGKITPSIPMIAIPMIFAVIMRPNFKDLSLWVTDGLKGQVSNAAMFTFAIIFFGVMMDAGVFDRIVGKMMLGAKSVTAVCILTVLATMIGHSDGSGATTYLIVIPPFLMIYKKLNMRPLILMCLVSITAGVMNCLPWGGPCGWFRNFSNRYFNSRASWNDYWVDLLFPDCAVLCVEGKKEGSGTEGRCATITAF